MLEPIPSIEALLEAYYTIFQVRFLIALLPSAPSLLKSKVPPLILSALMFPAYTQLALTLSAILAELTFNSLPSITFAVSLPEILASAIFNIPLSILHPPIVPAVAVTVPVGVRLIS